MVIFEVTRKKKTDQYTEADGNHLESYLSVNFDVVY